MPRFAANLTFLFTERPFLERFAVARAAGFDAVEALFPYAHPAGEVRHHLDATGLRLVLIITPTPVWADGGRGCAAIPGQEDRFRREFALALDYAEALGAGLVHIMSGLAAGPEARATYLRNLEWAVAQAPARRLTIEPINRIDMPGYWLDDVDKAFRLLRAVDRENVKIQLDLYHAQIIQGDLARTIENHLEQIGHIQIADNPGRHEPGTGEIHYPYLFDLLDRLNYPGWVGCEYKPATTTIAGLGWKAGR